MEAKDNKKLSIIHLLTVDVLKMVASHTHRIVSIPYSISLDSLRGIKEKQNYIIKRFQFGW